MSQATSGIELIAERELPRAAFSRSLSAVLDLTKFRLCTLVLLTTLAGFVMAIPTELPWMHLAWVLVGTGCAALGANALNQCVEVQRDAQMIRTRRRPLVAGTLTRSAGWCIGGGLSAAGPLLLRLAGAPLAAWLALGCTLLYVLVYTPLKPVTPLNTLVGAVCGAIPPLVGWAAARGTLDAGGWILAAVLFLWQIPHFLALAWLYREDYARGGFRMLPVVDPQGRVTGYLSLVYSLALVPVTAMLTLSGAAGPVLLVLCLPLGLLMIVCAAQLARRPSDTAARRLFLSSILYLPLLLGAIWLDRSVSVTAGWRSTQHAPLQWLLSSTSPAQAGPRISEPRP